MSRRINSWCCVVGVLLCCAPSRLFAQDVQTVKVTEGELSKSEYTFEPREIRIKLGKTEKSEVIELPAGEYDIYCSFTVATTGRKEWQEN